MRWPKILRAGIALFVVGFAAIVVVSLRRGQQGKPAAPLPPVALPKDVVAKSGAGRVERTEEGKVAFSITFKENISYADGRQKYSKGVKAVLPDRNGRSITVESQEAEVTPPPPNSPADKKIGTGTFSGAVKLTTSDGIVVNAATATYDDAQQLTTIPGPMAFKKGRMSGSGVGATYDSTRAVLWLLDQAKVDVQPDGKGAGPVHITSKQAGMARNEHYLKFSGAPHIDGEGRIVDSDEATIYLTPDDERMTRVELRGAARIASKPGGSGPQAMRARDIDLTYADDGRSLQSAHLVENAAVQMQGEKGRLGPRVAAKGLDIGLAPDGTTVTSLTGSENVQVDLPANGDKPATRIRSALLLATGAPSAGPGQAAGGINAARFGGTVEFRETRAATGKLAAVDRTARSEKLDIQTKPGFGDLERAEFQNSVHFTDGTQTTADAPMAVYSIAQDSLQLSPGAGNTGKGPHVSDGRVTIDAANILMGLASQKIKADTRVRSLMIPQEKGKSGDAVKVPSMLKQDRPVNVTSNRLDYDSGVGKATYEGNAKLWQDGDDTAEIKAHTIVVEDKSGNLHATGDVTSYMVLEPDTAASPAQKKSRPEPTITTAHDLLYEDGKHRATYTGSVHMAGPDTDVTADKMELFLAAEGGKLERAEADGNVVSKQELRRAFGKHLTYRAKEDIYTMVGTPAMVYDDTAPNCKVTKAPTVEFRKEANSSSAIGGTFGQQSEAVPCGSGPGTD